MAVSPRQPWVLICWLYGVVFLTSHGYFGSRDSAVGIVTGYEIESLEVGIRVPIGQYLSSFHVVQKDSGAHPTSYSMGTRGFFTVVKAARA
jgi:hypothetical protein